MKFADRLKDLRTSQKLSQEELAKKIKVSRSCIGNYEQGTREPKYEDLETIADYFNVDMDYLVGKSDKTSFRITEEEKELISMLRRNGTFSQIVKYAQFLNKEGSDPNET